MEWIEKNMISPFQVKWHSILEQKDKSWLLVVAIAVAVALSGSPVHLECRRAEVHGPVICTRQTRLLWIVPLPEASIDDVRGAHLVSVPGDDDSCDPCYRVELETGQGNIPLRSFYTNGSTDMELVVDKVNLFAHNETPGTLQINEPGLLSIDTLLDIVVGFVLATVAGLVWKAIKSVFRKATGLWAG